MGIVQGLTEFLPISSSGHLIVVPCLLGWDDPFINSLAFSVMLHVGTLVALLVYFRADWLRLDPGGPRRAARPLVRAATRIAGSPGCSSPSTIPAAIVGLAPQRPHRDARSAQVGLVALMLVVGGGDPAGSPTGSGARTRGDRRR